MKVRTRAFLGLAAAIIAIVAASPVNAAAPPPPVIRGTTVWTGTRTASMVVRLPKPVHLSIGDIAIQGGGRVYGVMIEDYPAATKAAASLLGFGMCLKAGCTPLVSDDRSGCVCVRDGDQVSLTEGTFPAGVYRVFLIADGAPVTATIRWPGLAGTVRLTPTGAVRSALLMPPPSQSAPDAAPVAYAAGATYTAGRSGAYVLFVTWKRELAPSEPGVISQCLYAGRPPAGSVPPYQQPCAGGSRNAPWAVGNTATDESGPLGVGSGYVSSLSGVSAFAQGTWSLGFSHTTAGPVVDAHTLELWLDR
jgi:hypothetical protein